MSITSAPASAAPSIDGFVEGEESYVAPDRDPGRLELLRTARPIARAPSSSGAGIDATNVVRLEGLRLSIPRCCWRSSSCRPCLYIHGELRFVDLDTCARHCPVASEGASKLASCGVAARSSGRFDPLVAFLHLDPWSANSAIVLFVDLVNSTALVSASDPEIVRRRVTQFFDHVSRCIETVSGMVEKFAATPSWPPSASRRLTRTTRSAPCGAGARDPRVGP